MMYLLRTVRIIQNMYCPTENRDLGDHELLDNCLLEYCTTCSNCLSVSPRAYRPTKGRRACNSHRSCTEGEMLRLLNLEQDLNGHPHHATLLETASVPTITPQPIPHHTYLPTARMNHHGFFVWQCLVLFLVTISFCPLYLAL